MAAFLLPIRLAALWTDFDAEGRTGACAIFSFDVSDGGGGGGGGTGGGGGAC